MTVYAKSEQADIPADEIMGIIVEYQRRVVEDEEDT
jgi:hypothetical protein